MVLNLKKTQVHLELPDALPSPFNLPEADNTKISIIFHSTKFGQGENNIIFKSLILLVFQEILNINNAHYSFRSGENNILLNLSFK